MLQGEQPFPVKILKLSTLSTRLMLVPVLVSQPFMSVSSPAVNILSSMTLLRNSGLAFRAKGGAADN